MSQPTAPNRFQISLFQNGMHSFRRGIREYEEYATTKDAMLLKDALMHLHHGIELLMKEILVRHNSFLIFEDLRDIAKKQKKADESGIDVFALDLPPKTVSYEEAIERVDTFVKPAELNERLRYSLRQLNRLRNQLEHYAIDVDIDEVTTLLGALQEPLLKLLEATLGNVKPLRDPSVSRVWNNARKVVEKLEDLEKKVIDVMHLFRNQKVSGQLFSSGGVVDLPSFNQIIAQYSQPEFFGKRIDVVGKSDSQSWAVELKRSIGISTLHLVKNSLKVIDAQPWLVIYDGIPGELRSIAQREHVFASDLKDLLELEKLLREK